ncbi:MAG: hypothetical protein QM692_05595 [Thermomicrobiales bacterium]
MRAGGNVEVRRYWAPIGPGAKAADPFGIHPDEIFGYDDKNWLDRAFRNDIWTLEDLATAPCLFLLGEPGMGKSTSVRQEVQRLKTIGLANEVVHYTDLGTLSSDPGLDAELHHDTIKRWLCDQSILHWFFDSYDECLRRYVGLQPRLLRFLEDIPKDRLRIRICCRSGDFPGNLPNLIHDLWDAQAGENGPVKIMQLERLSRSAVRAWALAQGVDPRAFLTEIQHRNASAFASHPITLDGLLTQFRDSTLPANEVGLYLQACQRLSDELNPNRQREQGTSSSHRLEFAEQIAVLMTLTGKPQMWLGHVSEMPMDALHVSDCVRHSNFLDARNREAEYQEIERVLEKTALFKSQDVFLVRWSQETYREFLAACFFAHRMSDATNAIQFLEHPGRPGSIERRIAPQFVQTAGWLSAMDERVAAWLVDHDPAVLLRGQHEVPISIRSKLTAWLLEEELAGRSLDVRWNAWTARAALDHPGLSEQLASIIGNANAHVDARWLACWLAGVCQRNDLEALLLAVALDEAEIPVVRWYAVRSLGEIGTSASRLQLRPLLDVTKGDSEDLHQLRAELLVATWPNQLSTSDALDYLVLWQTSPTDAYAHTFERRLASSMQDDELIDALAWIASHPSAVSGPLEFFLGDILTAGAARMDKPVVLSALVDTLSALYLEHKYSLPGHSEEFLSAVRQQESQVRVNFAEALISRLSALPGGSWYAARSILTDIELPLTVLLNKATTGKPAEVARWLQIIGSDSRVWSDPESVNLIQGALAGCSVGTQVHTTISCLLPTNSAKTQATPAGASKAPVPQFPSRSKVVGAWIDRSIVDPIVGWRMLAMVLNRGDDTDTSVLEYQLSQTPGWLEADARRKQQIIIAALLFLKEVASRPILLPRDVATVTGYQAAALIATEFKESLACLSATEWEFWLTLFAEAGSHLTECPPLADIVSVASKVSGDVILHALATSASGTMTPQALLRLLQALESYWSEPMTKLLIALLRDQQVPAPLQDIILAVLLTQGNEEAEEIGQVWVENQIRDRIRALIAVRRILLHGNNLLIGKVIDQLTSDYGFARVAIRFAAISRDSERLPQVRLSEENQANLYIAVADVFPPDRDDGLKFGVPSDRTPQHDIAELRGRLLFGLVRRGTWDALDQVDRIVRERPNLSAPKAQLNATEQATLSATWVALRDPQEVIRVAHDERHRIIRSDSQLLDFVCASLRRLQTELTRDGASADLWSEWKEGHVLLYRPKNEEALSDFLKRFIDRDLAHYVTVANREVENTPGSKTDLLVQCVFKEDPQLDPRRLSVVIEVKGAWHKDVKTSIATQLADRYLRQGQASNGIYVVSWFNCEPWDKKDLRRQKAKCTMREQLRLDLEKSAAFLTDEKRRVEVVLLDGSLQGTHGSVRRQSKS